MWAVKIRSVVPANGVDVGGSSEGDVWSVSATLKLHVLGGVYNRCSFAVLEGMRSEWVSTRGD